MLVCMCFFFFKQKTAYEMRISDWSSDVCSSDLTLRAIVDLDALPLAHDEIDAACRAQQPLGRTAIYHDGFLLPNIAPSVVGGAARRRRWFDGAPMMPRGLPRQSRLPPQEREKRRILHPHSPQQPPNTGRAA